MDAWDVYWIMQMDNIRDAVGGFAVASGITLFVASIFGPLALLGDFPIFEVSKSTVRRLAICFYGLLLPFFLATVVVLAFMPSTRTLAAMHVVPAVVNNEQLSADLADVYRLGMERLRDSLGDEIK